MSSNTQKWIVENHDRWLEICRKNNKKYYENNKEKRKQYYKEWYIKKKLSQTQEEK